MTRQRGFAIVSAIFILVVLAALGAFIVSVSTTQQVGSALDLQGSQAYQAARTGLEWGLYRQQRAATCTAISSFSPPAAPLSNYVVTVTCAATADGSGGPTTYRLSATACNQPVSGWTATTTACPNTTTPGTNYIERQLNLTF